MIQLEDTIKFRTDSEDEAMGVIATFKEQAKEKNYIVKKSNYDYRTKKSKGEIIDEAWVVTVTRVFATIWGDL